MKLDRTGWFGFVGAQAAFGSVGLKASLADPAVPSIFSPSSTPADSIYHLSLFVLAVTGAIFVVVFSLLAYAAIKFRRRADDDGREPPQIYGSNQVELAWTVIPVLIVVVLFRAAARVIHAVEDAKFSAGHTRPALDSVATRMTRDQLVRQVIQGGGNMPAYEKNLNPAEVAALVSFLETLHPAGRPPARNASQTAMQQTEPTLASSR